MYILVPPIVKVSPSSMMLPVSGVDIFLHCHVTGIPRPTIQWQFNDKVIPVRPDHYARIREYTQRNEHHFNIDFRNLVSELLW